MISSGVSHSDGSCVLGRIHSDVSSNTPKKVYHIVTDNFVNLLHISYAWLYKTECWGRKFHAFSFNSHRNCKIFMTNFNFIFATICVPYIFRKSIFGWNCDHDTPLCDTPLLEDTPLCDTPDDLLMYFPSFFSLSLILSSVLFLDFFFFWCDKMVSFENIFKVTELKSFMFLFQLHGKCKQIVWILHSIPYPLPLPHAHT